MAENENQPKNGGNSKGEADFDLMIRHGRRKGYITRKDVVDCFPDAKYDDSLFEKLLAGIRESGVEFVEEEPAGKQEEEQFDGDDPSLQVFANLDEESWADLDKIEADDMVRLYVREAAQVPLLNAEEELELAQRIELCDRAQEELKWGNVPSQRVQELRRIVEQGRAARERLIRANARLVISMARRYAGYGIPLLDLIQEGNIGLMRAIRNYDYHRGFKFSTYATWWIRQAITRALAEQSRTIRLPVHMSDQVNRLLREQSQLQQELGRPPTVEELSESLKVPPAKVEQILEVSRQPLSLQTPVGEEEEEMLGDMLEDPHAENPEETVSQFLMNEDLRTKLEALPPRELQILELRYGLGDEEPVTLQEAGRRMGITRERARQLEIQALERLRHPEAAEKRRGRRGRSGRS